MRSQKRQPRASTAPILVVDDHPAAHTAVTRLFRHSVRLECDGAFAVDEAMDALKVGSYRLILVDLMLPERAGDDPSDPLGLEVARTARRLQPEARVVLTTGHDHLKGLGAADGLWTVGKPLSDTEKSNLIAWAQASKTARQPFAESGSGVYPVSEAARVPLLLDPDPERAAEMIERLRELLPHLTFEHVESAAASRATLSTRAGLRPVFVPGAMMGEPDEWLYQLRGSQTALGIAALGSDLSDDTRATIARCDVIPIEIRNAGARRPAETRLLRDRLKAFLRYALARGAIRTTIRLHPRAQGLDGDSRDILEWSFIYTRQEMAARRGVTVHTIKKTARNIARVWGSGKLHRVHDDLLMCVLQASRSLNDEIVAVMGLGAREQGD